MKEFEKLKELCSGQSERILATVLMSINEVFDECEADLYDDVTESVKRYLEEDKIDYLLQEKLCDFGIWESENFYDLLNMLHDGAIQEQVPEDSNLGQDSTLLVLVNYTLKVSL